ncbi:KIR protein [Plasmodium coatneyi]|uniref:KIR protein n=1 Tax=Plasmodium coatneyi TaxID=208452 RepID=A0A1B1E1V9_9APIC|nr:KIR protein [Plasmodium coatneyi]ANQ08925.1 KIR protein [Plasmodium coatneyi]
MAGDTLLVGQVADMLPSEGTYALFKEPSECRRRANAPECNTELIKDVGTALKALQIKDKDLPSHIVQNWHYACTTKEGGSPYYDLCYFFYYWLGTQVKEKMTENYDFKYAMEGAYHHLKSTNCDNKCTNIYRDISDAFFKKSKELFDYNYNYKILTQGGSSNKCSLYEKLSTTLAKARDEYSWLGRICGSEDSSNSYCAKFQGGNGGWEYQEPNALAEVPCEEEDTFEDDTEDDLDEDDLDEEDDEDDVEKKEDKLTATEEQELKSSGLGKEYGYLGDSRETDCVSYNSYPLESIKEKVESVLGSNHISEDYAEKIVTAWCFAHWKKEARSSADSDWCYYFYYWLGTKVWERVMDKNEFFTTMDQIYQHLRGSNTDGKCNHMYKKIKKSDFKRMEKIFDYYKDHQLIKHELNKYGNDNHCKLAYSKYLKEALKAYEKIKSKCPEGGTTHPYCNDFNTKYKQQLYDELQQLAKCKVVDDATKPTNLVAHGPQPDVKDMGPKPPSEPELRVTEQSATLDHGRGGGGGHTTATATDDSGVVPGVTSALGVVAVPFITFLLYKVSIQL